jgi:hypothetical protein
MLASKQSVELIFSDVCGLACESILEEISIMSALLMIIVNSLGSICLSTNMRFFRSLNNSNLLLSACLIRKILAMQIEWGEEYQKLNSYF